MLPDKAGAHAAAFSALILTSFGGCYPGILNLHEFALICENQITGIGSAMDLKQLEYFRHVAELGSFTNAAAFLSVGQPTLSRRIADLETEFGQDLFDRNGRGVVLTQAGSHLLEHTRGILMQVGRALEELETTRGADAGHITLVLPSPLPNILTVPPLQPFA